MHSSVGVGQAPAPQRAEKDSGVDLRLIQAAGPQNTATRIRRAIVICEAVADVVTIVFSVLLSYGVYSYLSLGRHLRYPTHAVLGLAIAFAVVMVLMLDRVGAYRRANSLLRVRGNRTNTPGVGTGIPDCTGGVVFQQCAVLSMGSGVVSDGGPISAVRGKKFRVLVDSRPSLARPRNREGAYLRRRRYGAQSLFGAGAVTEARIGADRVRRRSTSQGGRNGLRDGVRAKAFRRIWAGPVRRN